MSVQDERRIAFVFNAKAGEELRAGKSDAQRIHSLLISEFGVCASDGPLPILDYNGGMQLIPTLADVLTEWRRQDQLIFYFSGHGRTKDGRFRLKCGLSDKSWVPFELIKAVFQERNVAKGIVILDACQSGGALEKSDGEITEPDLIRLNPAGFATVSSSGADEYSFELTDHTSSVFTNLLCSAIEKGLGKATPDGCIGVVDLVEHINSQLETSEYADYPQRALYTVDRAAGNIWVARNKSGQSEAISDKGMTAAGGISRSSEEWDFIASNTDDLDMPCEGAKIDDLDWELIREFAKTAEAPWDPEASREERARSLRLLTSLPSTNKSPLRMNAVLCFAFEPHQFIEGAECRIFYSDIGDRDLISETITGPLSRQIEECIDRVLRQMKSVANFREGARRTQTKEVPDDVIRELLSNAIAHRDYGSASSVDILFTPSDITVVNPGKFPDAPTWKEYLAQQLQSNPRNPKLVRFLRALGVFEKYGRGFQVFRKFVERNGEDSITYESIPGPATRITVKRLGSVKLKYASISDSMDSNQQIDQQIDAYLRWLRARTQSIELRGIERAGSTPVVLLPLETAYVPLRARSVPHFGDGRDRLQAQGRTVRRGDSEGDDVVRDESERDVALSQVLGLGKRLVIIGGPGCGKTTVLLHMAWALASSLLTGEPEPVRSGLGLETETDRLPLPIFVPLASFARYRRNLPVAAPAREKTLAHFISHHLISKQADFDLPADFFVQLLRNGSHVILLLDGLDEVANENERVELRQSVEDLASGRENMRVVVTCRTAAYRSGRAVLVAGFREIAVQPLDFEQHIAPMVHQAYACIHPRDLALRDERTVDLLEGIRRLKDERRGRVGEDAEVLVDSPLMVRLLLIVHVNNRRLPDKRADLFDKAINALLQVDYGREESVIRELSSDWKLFRDMAQHLALHMHRQGPDQGREIEEPEVKAALRGEADFEPRIDDFLSHARQRGSVLEERDGAYRFIHLAFQEFLVARYLREVTGGEGREAILAFLDERLDDPWWREPILLLAGYMGANAAKSAREFLRALAKAGSTANAQFAAAELAGTAALEWRESGEAVREECAQRILDRLREPDSLADSEPVLRANAGDVLASLGDFRFDRERFHLPEDDLLGFVPIPADATFRIGTRKAHFKRVADIIDQNVPENEINDEETPTPDFYIARYPVTVAQFRAFVEATEFEPANPDALRDGDSRPVRYVDWHEALAYCDWLSQALASAPALDRCEAARLVREESWRVNLPSELEWEKAARGGLADAVFPWGDVPDPNRANYADSEIGTTSAVACFPANGFGLYDITGNVWEWTRSVWGADWEKPDLTYPYEFDDRKSEALDAGVGVLRVVRGGSWHYDLGGARCACRARSRPGFRYGYLGFRVLLGSAAVP